MAVTLPSSAAASLLHRRLCAAPSVSSCRRRHWQRAAARRDGRGALLELPGDRCLSPAAANGGKRDRRVAAAAAAGGDATYSGMKRQGSLWMVFLSTVVAVWGSFEFGTCVGYSAPTQAGIMSDIGLSNSQYGVFGSVLTIGAMIGALTSGRLADILGRNMTMRLAAVIGIFGWITIYIAKDAMMLYAERVLLGYCTGVLSYVVPVFISEIAPKDIRGGLTTSNQLFICSGCSADYIIGALLSWRSLVLVGLVPCAILLTGLFVIPESPRWLSSMYPPKSKTNSQLENGVLELIAAMLLRFMFCEFVWYKGAYHDPTSDIVMDEELHDYLGEKRIEENTKIEEERLKQLGSKWPDDAAS